MVHEPGHGAGTLRSRDRAEDDYLTSTRWTFEDPPDDEPDRRYFGDVVRGFADRYGWRAYALPVLVVVTVAALVTMNRHPDRVATPTGPIQHGGSAPLHAGPGPSGLPSGPANGRLKTDRAGANSNNKALSSDALPAGATYTTHGDGTFRTLPGSGPVVGRGAVHRYTIDVENGLTGVDTGAFEHLVDSALDDPNSWTHGGVALQHVDSGNADFHITLVSSMTVRALCGFELQVETSCWAPTKGARVVLNVARWVRGDLSYIGDLNAYHVYMVNHETGHALGHMHSHACLSNGLAPVMMQQTIGLKSASGKICAANPWPYPPGVKDAPGVEGPDTPQNNPVIPS